MSLRRTPPECNGHFKQPSPCQSGAGNLGLHGLVAPSKLLFFHEIPSWQQDNEFILSGYRPTSGSVWISVASLLYVNNQTINTYSHLIGAVIFALLPFYFYYYVFNLPPNAENVDLLVICIYSYGVAVCFAFSSTFHLLWNHSQNFAKFCNKLDYVGILVLMWGAGIPTIYYGFFCNPRLQVLYWSTTSGAALCCAVFTLSPRFGSPQFRHWRASFYAAFGLSSVVFVAHGLTLHGWELQKTRMSLIWMVWMATANLTGAAIYAARVPERWLPYQFDIYGASHQIFHVAVIIAACVHFLGLMESFLVIRSATHACSGAWVA
ncbi:hypothetical protein JDV02_005710 [Purpureocillium takamizusanense]|uniref:Uncharacterized protein n=1 Tax=Purpureocillium takamizusanense TaxID=2060973 RepID=A0A9Q8QH01_9HYPO|nr:uncharacterized protein JDV02_005710 [Purpureocillium takamizusanense]UNI19528.1 hypothetical protein JDV02_005710 [Purpureocillium takamizusanense]